MDERTNGEILLKTRAFGGFEKTQVLAYIDTLREENRKAEEELGGKIAAISEAKNQLSNSIAQFERQIKSLEGQLDEKREKINDLTGVIDNLGAEISMQKRTLAQKDEEIKTYREKAERLRSEAEANVEQAKRYQELGAQVGEIILDARRSASEIISEAERAALSSRSEIFETASRIADEISGFRRDISDIRSSVAGMVSTVNMRIDAIEDAAADLESRLIDVQRHQHEDESIDEESETDERTFTLDSDDEIPSEPIKPVEPKGSAPSQLPKRNFFQGGNLFRPK